MSLDFAEGVLLAECGTPRATALSDPVAATQSAVSEPLEYPPLALCTTPGDRVVVPIDECVPQGGQVAAAVIQTLVASGVHPDGITLLRTARDAEAGGSDPSPWLPEKVRSEITLAVHDPGDQETNAYLAASDDGEPIVLSRHLTDADLVLPIGCVRPSRMAGYYGIYTSVFPGFSDQRTRERFLAFESSPRSNSAKDRLVEEADQIGWLLGSAFTIQVVPGPDAGLLHVLAGEVGEVRRRGQELYREAWQVSVPRRASLVVAAIAGDSDQQTWENVGRALESAIELVEDDGAIAVCSEVESPPGPAMSTLGSAEDRTVTMRQIRRIHAADALPAIQLAQVLDRARVYLLSRLDESLVEDLEVAPIAEIEELKRLTQRHKSCILLSNAPHAMVVAEESE